MKTQLLTLLMVLFSFFISCSKEDIGPRLKREAEEKLMGRWNLEKISHQQYDPIPTLKSTEEIAGSTEDYYVFKSNDIVQINAASASSTERPFEVINPNQIWLNDQSWWITELTAAKLVLKKDLYDAANNKRSVTIIYFRR